MKIITNKKLSVLLAVMIAFCIFVAIPTAAYAVNVGPRANTGDDPVNGIYVSPNGNDSSANGSIASPYKSINAALAAASPGATIILRGGTYQEGQNVRVNIPNITIKSAKGEWAVIDLTTYNSGNSQHSGVYFRPDASGCKLQNVEVKGGFYAVEIETTWDWGIEYYPTRYGASDIIIEDCILHDSRNDVVKVKPNCNNITIRYNEIYNSGREYVGDPQFEMGERNSEGIDNVNGANMIVQNNYIHDICSNAVYAKGGATDALIENNYIRRAYGAGIMAGFDTSPEFFTTSTNPKYYENIRGIVRNNLIIDTGWEGIGLYAALDAQVYNNTVVNAVGYGTGLYHSPIYFGIATQDWDNPTGCPPSVNPNIHHNVVRQPSTYNNRMIDIRYDTNVYSFGLSALTGNPVMNYNCYYVIGKNATFTDNRPDSELRNAGLPAWRAHISGDSGSVEADPTLDADYLATNPLCVGAGTVMGIMYPLTISSLDIPPVETVVNIAAVPGVTAPVAGAAPVTTITETAQYTGAITWSGNPVTFAFNTAYTATITLTAKPGFTLTGVRANFFTVAGATTVSNSANSGVITAVFPATGSVPQTVINIAAIPGVTTPVAGAAPVTAITETAQYTGAVTWSGNPVTFAYNTTYTATITLTAKPGYTLTGVGANFFTVAGATTVANSANSGVITAVFPTTGGVPQTVINIAAVPGVTPPVAGAAPVTAVTETAQYTGAVTWSGNPVTFAYNTAYTATITLTAKPGYTLTGVGANFFSVAGATSVANSANSGVITALFPATGGVPQVVINIAAVPGVTPPVAGATPVTAITETAQYTGAVTWSGNPVTFAYNTAYTATITLTAKPGYTLTGVGANLFTVAGATTVANSANSGVITAAFPATGGVPQTVINIAAVPGVTPPVAGANPVTAITETAQYTGAVTWSGNPVTFAYNTAYTATITLTAKPGYTLTGVGANFFSVAGATSVANSANSGVITAVFPATGGVPQVIINIAAVPGVTPPVAGATPVTTITETAQYTGAVTWSGNPVTFAYNTAYTATITLAAKPGYTLTGVGANFFSVAGAITVTNSANSGVITALFPTTGGVPQVVINIAAIPGVTPPTAGATPVTTIAETSQYTGVITWSGNPVTFAYNTVYTATITLAAKPGYTLTGVGANFFTVAGATTVANSANNGVITAVFPATGADGVGCDAGVGFGALILLFALTIKRM